MFPAMKAGHSTERSTRGTLFPEARDTAALDLAVTG
jgi:hypothetical protein